MAHTMNTGTIVAIVGEQSEDALAALDGIRGVDVLALQGSEPAVASDKKSKARGKRNAWGSPDIKLGGDPCESSARQNWI